jgi:hypothetical protein
MKHVKQLPVCILRCRPVLKREKGETYDYI